MIRHMFGLPPAEDEHLLAGADEASIQAIGVSQPVLSRFEGGMAVLCPDLLLETQRGMGGK